MPRALGAVLFTLAVRPKNFPHPDFRDFPADLDTTQQMIAPLSSVRLQHLRLNLGPHVYVGQELDILLSESVRRSTIQPEVVLPSPEPPFSFERLPHELQEMILSHTGLVITPHSLHERIVDILGIHIEDKPHPLINDCCGTCNTENFANCICYSNYKCTCSSTCTCRRMADCHFRVNRSVKKGSSNLPYLNPILRYRDLGNDNKKGQADSHAESMPHPIHLHRLHILRWLTTLDSWRLCRLDTSRVERSADFPRNRESPRLSLHT
jgi:hypothetical protein